MKTSINRFYLVLGMILIVGASVHTARAQLGNKAAPRGDVRVQRALDALKLTYEVTAEGNFGLISTTIGKRTQVVVIDSATEKFRDLEIREVWSPAMTIRGQVPASTANRLLQDKNKFGSWNVNWDGTSSKIYFAAHLSVDADAETLSTIISFVSSVADQMELELTGKDDN